ncbi:Inner membrane protein YjjP [Acidipropionibacterium jensenii]|uniref:Inner membrane protein YjjP n=1 Tax=Acidipropionibacterium jensenii TaxID=1749 RepID=A0A448NXJ4_9ACTN|nr:threonine/serine exporter family protein [Acidipropionibacterium jensenii]VEI02599.1 Inner membrane protein YjjP [Acidipropionibacterium jensenii]
MANARNDRQFIDDTEAVVRLGSMLLSAGTGSYRVKRAMERAAATLGMDRHDASVGLTEMSVTAHRGDNFRTVVREVYRVRVDSSRIESLEYLSRHLPNPCNAAALEAELDRISRTVTARWKPWQTMLAAGVACAGFSILNRFPLTDTAVVLVAASCGQMVRMFLARRWLNQFGSTALAAATSSLVYLLVAFLANLTGIPQLGVSDPGYVASLLFLVPGFPMITSILDFARMDLTAGLTRAAYSLGIVVSATMSAWVISFLTGLTPLATVAALPGLWQWAAYAAATFLGVSGFAILFNSTRRMVLIAASLGTIGNLSRLALVSASAPAQLAAGFGGLVVGLVAAPLTRRLPIPRITVTVPACVIMVPGTAMYRMMYWFNGEDTVRAIGFGVDAVLAVVAIGIGLALARMLTDPAWTFARPIPSPHAFRTDHRGIERVQDQKS